MKGAHKTALLIVIASLASGCSMLKQEDAKNEMAIESSSSAVAETESSSDSENSSQSDSSESSSTSDPQKDTNETKALTTEEVLNQVEKDLDTDLIVQLPKNLPLRDNMYLTARAVETDGGYEVVFYESTVQLPVNDTSLGDGETEAYPIGRVTVQEYTSETESLEAVGYTDFNETGGYEEVDLDFGITGYRDSATGQTYISWNEGRWSLSTEATTDDPQSGVDLAKEAVAFLEEHTLPTPNQYGSVKLDIINNEHSISWQEGNAVVTVDLIEDPLEALKTATSIK